MGTSPGDKAPTPGCALLPPGGGAEPKTYIVKITHADGRVAALLVSALGERAAFIRARYSFARDALDVSVGRALTDTEMSGLGLQPGESRYWLSE